MISSILLCIFIIPVLCVQSNMPDALKHILHGSNDERTFWGMSKNHPMRMELERDPGILIGRVEDFDIAAIRKGDLSNLGKGRMQSKSRNPVEIFFRKQRSTVLPQCDIEIPMIKSYPGRCIRLAGGIPACKSDKYIAINNKECN